MKTNKNISQKRVEILAVKGAEELISTEAYEETGLWIEEKGDEVKKGTTVTLTVSSGTEAIEIPDLTGSKKEDAVNKLTQLGLKYEIVTEYSSDFEIDEIKITTENIIDVTINSYLRFKKAFFMFSKAVIYLAILKTLTSLNNLKILIKVIFTVQNDK